MREIKFRAWDGKRMTTSGIMFNNTNSCLEVPQGSQMKLMQYTGLKDKNGKEIYEGDVNQYGYVIKYCQEKALFGEYGCRDGINYDVLMSYTIDSKSQIIKGNIYENPELL